VVCKDVILGGLLAVGAYGGHWWFWVGWAEVVVGIGVTPCEGLEQDSTVKAAQGRRTPY
jgi:hypothetical protein